jgi:WhiB family redox-sensing transcriptional regulator
VCKQVDPDLFVGDGHSNDLRHRHNLAIKICHTCPVIEQCQEYALTLAQDSVIHGVWGGMHAVDINRQARDSEPRHVA